MKLNICQNKQNLFCTAWFFEGDFNFIVCIAMVVIEENW